MVLKSLNLDYKIQREKIRIAEEKGDMFPIINGKNTQKNSNNYFEKLDSILKEIIPGIKISEGRYNKNILKFWSLKDKYSRVYSIGYLFNKKIICYSLFNFSGPDLLVVSNNEVLVKLAENYPNTRIIEMPIKADRNLIWHALDDVNEKIKNLEFIIVKFF